MIDLSGKRILVTGAAGGIGAAVADCVERCGGAAIRSDIAGGGGIVPCDITDRVAVMRLFDAATAAGPLDGVVHCAALCGTPGPFHSVGEDTWLAYVGTNLTGTFHVCQEAARRMIAAGTAGRLVVIGSVNALTAERNNSPYAASKGGVRLLVKAMANDLAPFGIAANLVHPGPIAVPRNRDKFDTPGFRDLFDRQVPAGVPGSPEDVARAAVFLVDPAGRYITGAELAVDGGLTGLVLGGAAPART